jgi:uncharacterized protein (DUF433 family)
MMSTSLISVQLPEPLYARLQSRAAREHTDPVEMIGRLIAAESSPTDAGIVADAVLRGGQPVIAGTGVTVRTIVGHYKLGLSPEEIADQLELELAWVYTALAYYHAHRAEIEADIAANSEEAVMKDFGAAAHA